MNYKLEHGKLVMQRGRAGRRVNYLCHPIKDTVRDLSLRLETRDEKSTSRPEHGIAIPGQKRQVMAGLSNRTGTLMTEKPITLSLLTVCISKSRTSFISPVIASASRLLSQDNYNLFGDAPRRAGAVHIKIPQVLELYRPFAEFAIG
jgi:hypothetical protein